MKQQDKAKMMVGLAAGTAAVGLGTAWAMQNRRSLKRAANRTMHSVSQVLDEISSMIG